MTLLAELKKSYELGNRQPRGQAYERLNWVEFTAFRRREEHKRLARLPYVPDMPADCIGCAVGRRWTDSADELLCRQFEAGWDLAAMVRYHERTRGAIVERLRVLGYVIAKWTPGEPRKVFLRPRSKSYRPEWRMNIAEHGLFAVRGRDKIWRATYNG